MARESAEKVKRGELSFFKSRVDVDPTTAKKGWELKELFNTTTRPSPDEARRMLEDLQAPPTLK